MVQYMKVNGKIILLGEEVNYRMQMEMNMKENGSEIKQMGLVFIFIQMGLVMKDNGKMINRVEKG